MTGASCHLLLVVCILLSLSGAGTQKAANCARWCPPNSECTSIRSCICKPGFNSEKKIITNPAENCEDINECLLPEVSCGSFATCKNSEGSYACVCNPGYKLLSGAESFTNQSENTCQDVDECSSGQHQCHSSTICNNTLGSYKCRCRPGWKPISRSLDGPKNTICQEPAFPTWTLLPSAHSQTLLRFSVEVQNLLRDFNPAMASYTIQKLIDAVDKLLGGPLDLETQTQQVATQLLSNLEQSLRTLAQFLPKGPFTYTSPSNTELSLMVKERDNKDVTTVQHSQAWMKLDWAVTAGAKGSENGYSMAGILSSPNIKSLLANASLDLEQTRATLEDVYGSPVRRVSLRLLSDINSIFLTNTDTEKLASNVTFKLNFTSAESVKEREELMCAFWKARENGSGYWATDGCWMNDTGFCHCNHLSSFAILMAQYDVQDPRLELITKVGLLLSLVCLLLCILTFLLVKPIQSSRTMVHLHLCISLFLGSIIFLVGVENEGGKVGLRCRLVAVMLHFCFLAAFCWMALEGVELYFLVVRVFQGQGLSTWHRCLIGYGVPLLIVAISMVAVKMDGYGHATYCWLDFRKQGFLWSFSGPVAFIILCNAAIFVITVWKLTEKFSEINPNMKKLKKARVLTITAIAQFLVLGCTWGFGLFLFNPHSTWLSYIFTLLNCLQGVFLYVTLCLLNKKVREEYWKWACLVTGSKYTEFNSSTTGTGTSQSRALRPSESGM
ncbi:adhesion G protein-coupled receptor E5 isoform X3 [Apodemus sylvaticus]|uniref:adhesion G protein-coupled receptor E5 isoform X3 n=1 Tax=Apodemus sylvaticus TaxID=10129 RepID=UPI002243E35F|nr:adhesion G protein-coupled receptor E5 isoform X3 [Apodemus sylvaticus]